MTKLKLGNGPDVNCGQIISFSTYGVTVVILHFIKFINSLSQGEGNNVWT
jgi:hypothetical protein